MQAIEADSAKKLKTSPGEIGRSLDNKCMS